MSLLRRHIGQHRDNSFAAKRKQRHDLIIVSGVQINVSVGQGHNLCHLGNITGGFLDTNNIFHIFYQMRYRCRLDITSGTLATLYMIIGAFAAFATAV